MNGWQVVGFDAASWRPHRTRDLASFLAPPRDRAPGYFDQACLPEFCSKDPPYERRGEQRCAMPPGDGAYYFYSGFFGGSGSWMMAALVTLQQWTAQDWAQGFDGARVDDEVTWPNTPNLNPIP